MPKQDFYISSMRERESTRVEIVRPSSGKLGCTFRLLAGREGGGIKSSDWTFHFLYKSATNLVNVSRVIESSKIGRGRESDFPPGANKLTRRRWLMRMLCNTEKEGFLRRINKLQMPLNPHINTSVWAHHCPFLPIHAFRFKASCPWSQTNISPFQESCLLDQPWIGTELRHKHQQITSWITVANFKREIVWSSPEIY